MKLPHLDWVNQDSPYLRQHQRGFRGLSFDDELEQTFKRYHANVFLRRMRWALLVATLLALLFVLLDAINLPDPLRGQILTLRLGVIQPLLLLAWVLYVGHWLGLFAVPLFVLYITRFQIVPEERVLAARFADEYAEFRRRVHRWL